MSKRKIEEATTVPRLSIFSNDDLIENEEDNEINRYNRLHAPTVYYPDIDDYDILSRGPGTEKVYELLFVYTQNTIHNYKFGDDLYQSLNSFISKGNCAADINDRHRHVSRMMSGATSTRNSNSIRIRKMVKDVFL